MLGSIEVRTVEEEKEWDPYCYYEAKELECEKDIFNPDRITCTERTVMKSEPATIKASYTEVRKESVLTLTLSGPSSQKLLGEFKGVRIIDSYDVEGSRGYCSRGSLGGYTR